MQTKKYSSYEQIELELKILKLEKDLSVQKMVWSVQKIKESFTPKNIISEGFSYYKSVFSSSYGLILGATIPILIKWLKRKRGN
jgi:hypothetical protein